MQITIMYFIILFGFIAFFTVGVKALARSFARCIAREVVKEMNKNKYQ